MGPPSMFEQQHWAPLKAGARGRCAVSGSSYGQYQCREACPDYTVYAEPRSLLVSSYLQSALCTVILGLIWISWKAREPIPSILIRALQAHGSVKQIVTESCVFVNGKDAIYVFDPALTLPLSRTAAKEAFFELAPVKRTIDTRAKLDTFYFTNYCFPSGLEAMHHVDPIRLSELTLDGCNNIGFLFNGLLSNVSRIRLEKLVISRARTQSAVGYIGKEKIECFLAVYKGLKEIALSNMGEDRPSLTAILTQGRSLRTLKLYETRRKYTSEARNGDKSIEVEEDVARIYNACPLLDQLIIGQGCNCGKRRCCCKPSTWGNMHEPVLIQNSSRNL